MSTEKEIAAVTRVLQGCRPCDPTIIELGAYGGEDSEFMRAAVKDTHRINVMVEPDRRNCEIIRRDRRGVNTVIVEAAIADYTGMIDFYEAVDVNADGGRSGSGSIRNPDKHQQIFPDIKFQYEDGGFCRPPRLMPCWSLDHLTYSLGIFGEIDMLWVDIQGAERDMIAGGQNALSRTRYLFIEAETTELYEGMALRDELLTLLPGFKVIEEFEYNLLLEAK